MAGAKRIYIYIQRERDPHRSDGNMNFITQAYKHGEKVVVLTVRRVTHARRIGAFYAVADGMNVALPLTHFDPFPMFPLLDSKANIARR